MRMNKGKVVYWVDDYLAKNPQLVAQGAISGRSNEQKMEEIRLSLLEDNFVLHELSRIMKSKTTKKDWEEAIGSPMGDCKIIQFIHKLRKELDVDHPLLCNMLMLKKGEMVWCESIFDDILIVRRNQQKTVTLDGGVYVTFRPNMTDDDWLKLLEPVRTFYSLRVANPNEKEFKQPDRKPRTQLGQKDEKRNIDIYLKIEKNLSKQWQDKMKGPIRDSEAGPDNETVEVAVVSGAVDMVAKPEEIKNETKRERKRNLYRDIYYDVARRYNLPILRDLSKYTAMFDSVLAS